MDVLKKYSCLIAMGLCLPLSTVYAEDYCAVKNPPMSPGASAMFPENDDAVNHPVKQHCFLADRLFSHLHFDGNLRNYYFTRSFSMSVHPQSAFAVGGKLNMLTDPFLKYFKLGATVYTSQPMGLNAENSTYWDTTLPAVPVTVLGQAFLQFQNKKLLARVGNQELNTPWVNWNDTRMILALFQGAYAEYNPIKDLTFYGMRLIRYKEITSANFNKTNRYYPINGGPFSALNRFKSNGVAAWGSRFTHHTSNTEVWLYQFYDYGKLLYGNSLYTFPAFHQIKPQIGIQLGREWNDGSAVLQTIGQGSTNATIYGVMLGAESDKGKIALSYNLIPTKSNKYFRRGDVVSPYAIGNDPLYTASIVTSLAGLTAGSAVRLNGEYAFTKKFTTKASYAEYYTNAAFSRTTELNLDFIYTICAWKTRKFFYRLRLGHITGAPGFGRVNFLRSQLQFNY